MCLGVSFLLSMKSYYLSKKKKKQPGYLEIMGSGSNPVMSTQEIKLLTSDDHLASHGHLHRPQWEASNRFSLVQLG